MQKILLSFILANQCYLNKSIFTIVYKRSYIYIYIYIYGWVLECWIGASVSSFDPSFGNLACLATLKSCDTTKQSVYGWQYIMSHRQHGYHWPSLATSPYRSSLPAGLQGYIPYPHRAAVCMFEVAVLLLPGHMWESIGVHLLWAGPCFSSSVLHVWFV